MQSRIAGRWRWASDGATQAYQQVVGSGVQVEAEVVGHETMIAGAVDGQVAFEFFVAVFTFAAGGIVVVSRLGQHAGTRTIGDDKTAIGALGMGFGFGDDPTRPVPGAGLIPKAIEEPLGFFSNGELRLCPFQQGFAVSSAAGRRLSQPQSNMQSI